MNQLKNPSLFKQQCYVAGHWTDATSKKTFPVDNPFDNSQLGTVPDFDTADCQKAIAAANAAWTRPVWVRASLLPRVPRRRRGAVMALL